MMTCSEDGGESSISLGRFAKQHHKVVPFDVSCGISDFRVLGTPGMMVMMISFHFFLGTVNTDH